MPACPLEKLQPCLIGIEACATSHHWSRALTVLGHTVRLMLPAYVKPYVKRQKNDVTDAAGAPIDLFRSSSRRSALCLPLHPLW